jgi:hypothetical protein
VLAIALSVVEVDLRGPAAPQPVLTRAESERLLLEPGL